MTTTAYPSTPANLIEQIGDLFMAGGSLGVALGYTTEDYETVYALGHGLYEQRRYLDAMKAFAFLVIHSPIERRYLNALAASLQMLGHYRDAIAQYTIASVLDLTDPAPTFHTAECLLRLGLKTEAIQALGHVVRQCKTAEQESLKARAADLLTALESSEMNEKNRRHT